MQTDQQHVTMILNYLLGDKSRRGLSLLGPDLMTPWDTSTKGGYRKRTENTPFLFRFRPSLLIASRKRAALSSTR